MQALLTTAAALLDADSQNSGTLRAIMGHVEAANCMYSHYWEDPGEEKRLLAVNELARKWLLGPCT